MCGVDSTHPLLPGLPKRLTQPVTTIWIRKKTRVPSQKPMLTVAAAARDDAQGIRLPLNCCQRTLHYCAKGNFKGPEQLFGYFLSWDITRARSVVGSLRSVTILTCTNSVMCEKDESEGRKGLQRYALRTAKGSRMCGAILSSRLEDDNLSLEDCASPDLRST